MMDMIIFYPDTTLKDYHLLKSFCALIPIKIEYLDEDSEWSFYFSGKISIIDCEFDYKKKQVSTLLLDDTAADILQTGKDKEYIVTCDTANNDFERGAYNSTTNNFDNIYNDVYFKDELVTGNCDIERRLFNYYKALRQVVHESSKLRVTIRCDKLSTDSWQYFSACRAENLEGSAKTPPDVFRDMSLSLSDMLEDSNTIFNWAAWSGYSSGVPFIRIEPFSDVYDNDSGLSYDNNEAVMSFDIGNMYSSVNTTPVTELDLGYIDNEITAKSLDSCSTEKLDLQTKYFRTNNAIRTLLTATLTDDIKNKYCYIEVYDDAGTLKAGTAVCGTYNTQLDPLLEWIYSLQSDFVSWNNVSYAKPNNPIVNIWEFDKKISLSDYKTIRANPYRYVTIESEYLDETRKAYISDFEFSNKNDSVGNALVKFKLKSE
jgi:hypothetical protein